MGDIEEVQAMLSMKRLIESNAAAEADLTHPFAINQANQPIPDMLGQGGEVLGSTGGPHVGHNRNAYPYGLPPQLYATYHAHAQQER